MPQWEYRSLEIPYTNGSDVGADLDQAGQDGWEAVDMHVRWANTPDTGIHDEVMIVLLKRPKAESKPWR